MSSLLLEASNILAAAPAPSGGVPQPVSGAPGELTGKVNTGVALDVLGTVHHRLGAHDRAVDHYEQALATHRDIGNRWGEGHTLGHLGDVQLAAGDPEAADGSWRQALAIFAEFDHPDAEKIKEKLNSPRPTAR